MQKLMRLPDWGKIDLLTRGALDLQESLFLCTRKVKTSIYRHPINF
jgi:hypothetical protein